MYKRQLLPSTQGGFRSANNICDQLVKVISAIIDNSARKHPTILALLDTRKAFDSVWDNGLRFKILGFHFPSTIIKWVSQFLDGRTAQVRVRQLLSPPFQLNAGVPQGSAISPELYILFTKNTRPPVFDLPFRGSCPVCRRYGLLDPRWSSLAKPI